MFFALGSAPALTRHAMVADCAGGFHLGEFGPPTALFRMPTLYRTLAPATVPYEVSSDGQKFLVPIRKEAGAPLQVVVNWQAGLKG